MPDYKTMYYELAAKVADVIEMLEAAMLDGESSYMLSEDALQSSSLSKSGKENSNHESIETH